MQCLKKCQWKKSSVIKICSKARIGLSTNCNQLAVILNLQALWVGNLSITCLKVCWLSFLNDKVDKVNKQNKWWNSFLLNLLFLPLPVLIASRLDNPYLTLGYQMAEPIGLLNWQIFENTPKDCIDEIQLFLIGLLTEITREFFSLMKIGLSALFFCLRQWWIPSNELKKSPLLLAHGKPMLQLEAISKLCMCDRPIL